jgi:thymidylate synthase (FAD)
MSNPKIMKPEVHLLSWTKDPLKVIYAEIQMYDCKTPITNLDEVSEEQAKAAIQEALKSHLKGCLEKISVVFQLKNVPRAFTHQMVRTRIGASYAQQSMRFTEFDSFSAYNPPSLPEKAKEHYEKAMQDSFENYTTLLELGCTAQDARGALPIATNTHIMVNYTFKTLVDLAEKRLCVQAQGHWHNIIVEMKKQIAEQISPFLASLLRPKCIGEGKCPYQSDLDRDCPIAIHFGFQEEKKKYVHEKEDASWQEKISIARQILGTDKFNPKFPKEKKA